jgi:hypothetical protein
MAIGGSRRRRRGTDGLNTKEKRRLFGWNGGVNGRSFGG